MIIIDDKSDKVNYSNANSTKGANYGSTSTILLWLQTGALIGANSYNSIRIAS